jgi:hypothetical protein
VNSKERKGGGGRVLGWARSRWQHPDGSTSQEYLFIAVATLVFAVCFAAPPANIGLIVATLVLGLMIASLVKGLLWREEKLLRVRNVLLDTAFQECRCDPNAIITDAPMEPELVGKPVGKGYCHVCRARSTLKEQFPGAIETEIRERLGEYRQDDGRWVLNNLPRAFWLATGPIPKDLDLAAYLSPVELEWHRAAGQLPEPHEAKPQ